MKPKVYIETSVVSYLTSRLSRNDVIRGHQAATRLFWGALERFDVFISELVLLEAGRGDEKQSEARLAAVHQLRILDIGEAAEALAGKLITEHAVPIEQMEDAMHIAVAAINGMEFIVTWNFRHINNPVTRALIRRVIETAGLVAPEICTPEELTGEPV